MSVPTQIHLNVTSTQCVTIPKDLTFAPAKRDFTKMDKTALVTLKNNCFLWSFQGTIFSQCPNYHNFPSQQGLLNPLTSSVPFARGFFSLAGPWTNSAAAGPSTCTDLLSLRHMMGLLLWIPTECQAGNVGCISSSIIHPVPCASPDLLIDAMDPMVMW